MRLMKSGCSGLGAGGSARTPARSQAFLISPPASRLLYYDVHASDGDGEQGANRG